MRKSKLMGLLMILATSLSLAACGKDQAPTKKANLPSTFFNSDNSQSSAAQKQQIQINNFIESLQKNYKKLFKVSYDQSSDTVTLVPISKDVKQIITLSKQNNSEGIKAWNNFVSGLQKTTKNVSKETKDTGFTMNMVDPSNHSTVLYSTQAGKVLKNAYQQ